MDPPRDQFTHPCRVQIIGGFVLWIYRLYFVATLAVMLASLVPVISSGDFATSGALLWNDPWARLTLVDAVLALGTLYLVLIHIERRTLPRILWFFLICLGGSAAIASFFLLRLMKGQSPSELFAPATVGDERL